VPALRARFGAKLLYAGDQQQTFVSGFLSATPDGLLIDQSHDVLASVGIADIGGDGSIVVECKTIDPRVKLDAPKPEHAFQAQVQIGLFRELTPHRPEVALISYANASFLDDVIEFVVRFEPAIFANAKRRAAAILTAQEAQQLKPEGWIAGGRECEFCAFNRACGVIRHAVPTKPVTGLPDPQFVAEIADLAREAKQRRAEAEAATRRQRAAEEDIRERLRPNACAASLATTSPSSGRRSKGDLPTTCKQFARRRPKPASTSANTRPSVSPPIGSSSGSPGKPARRPDL
jgi:hypothetical protein